jgi:hypothetical protein
VVGVLVGAWMLGGGGAFVGGGEGGGVRGCWAAVIVGVRGWRGVRGWSVFVDVGCGGGVEK